MDELDRGGQVLPRLIQVARENAYLLASCDKAVDQRPPERVCPARDQDHDSAPGRPTIRCTAASALSPPASTGSR